MMHKRSMVKIGGSVQSQDETQTFTVPVPSLGKGGGRR